MKIAEEDPSSKRKIEVKLEGNDKIFNKNKMENETTKQQSAKRSSKHTNISDTALTADVNEIANKTNIIVKENLIIKSESIHNRTQNNNIKLSSKNEVEMYLLSASVLKIHKEKINFSILIKHHKLTLISNANSIGDCCFDSALKAYFNQQIPFLASTAKILNKMKWGINNLVRSGKTILK